MSLVSVDVGAETLDLVRDMTHLYMLDHEIQTVLKYIITKHCSCLRTFNPAMTIALLTKPLNEPILDKE